MQKGLKEGFLKILKGYKDLQEPTLKADRDNLNDFRNNLKSLKSFFKSFKDTLEKKIEP